MIMIRVRRRERHFLLPSKAECISSVNVSNDFPFILCRLSLPLLSGRTNLPCFFRPMLQPGIYFQTLSAKISTLSSFLASRGL